MRTTLSALSGAAAADAGLAGAEAANAACRERGRMARGPEKDRFIGESPWKGLLPFWGGSSSGGPVSGYRFEFSRNRAFHSLRFLKEGLRFFRWTKAY